MKKKLFFEDFDTLYYFHGASPSWEMAGMHLHKQYEVILFMSEGVKLEIGSRVYEVGKGDIFFINNKEYHRAVVQKGETYERYVLMFDPEFIGRIADALDSDPLLLFEMNSDEDGRRLRLTDRNLERTEALLGEIERGISKGPEDPHNRLHLKLKMLELLNMLDALCEEFYGKKQNREGDAEKDAPERGKPDGDTEGSAGENTEFRYRERTEQIKKYIAEHVEERLNLDEIADRFYINRYYLSHYFKTETGFTLTQYITNQKISAAKKMLMSGMSVTDVALRLSYKSDSHFISVFKKNTGITPKQYAKEKNSKNA